jgi:DNA invertase Pin-like site-specific DNA recombinase
MAQPPRKVIGLLRVSTLGQAAEDRGGLLRQREVVERTVSLLKLDCIEIVTLNGVSGTEVRRNQEVIRLLKLIETREIDGLVVADIDRLMRPAAGEDFALLDPFIDARARIFANGVEFDFASPASAMIIKVLFSVAEFERSMIVNRSRGAVRKLCEAGRHPFGIRQLPRGITYTRESNTWSTNEHIAPVLEAFRLMDEDGVTNVADVARRVGIHERALHNLVRNPLYSGWRIYSTGREAKKVVSRNGRPYKRKVPLPDDEIIRVRVLDPAPVSEERFKRVQILLAATLKNWKGQRADRPDYNLLRSVARCGACEARLYFSQDRRRPNTGGYYFCAKHNYRKGKQGTCGIRNQSKAELDSVTLSFVSEILTKPTTLRAIIAHSEATAEANRIQPEIPKTDPATFGSRRRRLKDAYEGGVITMADLRERLSRVQADEDAIRRVAESQAKSTATPEIEKLIERIIKGALAFNRLTDSSWRLRIIQQLFSAIFYEDGQISRFKLQPTMFQDAVCEELQNRDWDSSPRRA